MARPPRPPPDLDCDRLRFAHAGRPKPHARWRKPQARRHEPGAGPAGNAECDGSRSSARPEHRSPRPRSPRHRAPARLPSTQPESPRPTTGDATGQLDGAVPLSSVLIALAVLVLVSLVLLRLARKGEGQVAQPEGAPPRSATEPATDVLVLLSSAGEALIDSGFDVDDVDANLEDIARAYGMADTEIIAMPTALLVSSRTVVGLRPGQLPAAANGCSCTDRRAR